MPPSFKNKTCGLCGTFNNNQHDDYETPEGVVESNPTTFGNSWKMDTKCKDATTRKHPCDTQVQREPMANKKCNKLKLAPFTACHDVVDPDEYIENCRYDVCACSDGIKCLCNAVAAYTKACADRGVIIEWRNEKVLQECGKFYHSVKKIGSYKNIKLHVQEILHFRKEFISWII